MRVRTKRETAFAESISKEFQRQRKKFGLVEYYEENEKWNKKHGAKLTKKELKEVFKKCYLSGIYYCDDCPYKNWKPEYIHDGCKDHIVNEIGKRLKHPKEFLHKYLPDYDIF